MHLKSHCRLSFQIQTPVTFILMLRPRSGQQQWISREEYNIEPIVEVKEFVDKYGNLCQRLVAPADSFSINTFSEVHLSTKLQEPKGPNFIEVKKLPEDVLEFLLPSRYCESDRFLDMCKNITYNKSLGYDQVKAIEKWMIDKINYLPGSSDFPISAAEVNQRGYGVCRDLAHLGIALTRALSIPARIVVGFLHELEPQDFHAWFEAFVDGKWHRFDATQKNKKHGYIAVGYGRDAADVAVYNQFGPMVVPTEQKVDVQLIEKDI